MNKIKILDKEIHRNIPNIINKVTFSKNGKINEVQVIYIPSYNRYAFIQYGSDEDYQKYMKSIELGTQKERNNFIKKLQKYSKLGKMKEEI